MFKLLRIEGFSLYPLYKEGEVVLFFKILSFTNLKKDDVVVFKKENKLMVKRIEYIKNGEFSLKGTTPYSRDSRNFGLLKREELLYKALFKIFKK